MRFPSDLRADPLLPEEMLIVSPSASASGAGSRSCLLMLPGRWGVSSAPGKKTLNPIDYVMERWFVFPTEKQNVFGQQGESPPVHFPAPSGVVLAKTATSVSARRTASSPRSCGAHRGTVPMRGLGASAGAGGGKVRLPRAQEAAGAARVAPAGSEGRCEKGRARGWKRIFARLERLINTPVPSSQPA